MIGDAMISRRVVLKDGFQVRCHWRGSLPCVTVASVFSTDERSITAYALTGGRPTSRALV